jgi:carboxyl-terminal processing protease
VNRRVSLLPQYAPRRLHELRQHRAERLGEKPLGEFRDHPSNHWRERTRDVRPEMLKGALETAAKEHIESDGWRPLLRGGLRELRLLATTASLDESFAKLADPKLVAQWVALIDKELADLELAKDGDLDRWTLSRILDNLMRENVKTVEIPKEVLYREFGDGALYELDEFSEIVWPDKLSRFRQATEGNFVGVGILIRHNDTQEIVVVNPLEGTPAYFGGVKPNDRISEVDGESTVGWSLNDAVDRITGEPDTKVTLGVQREGVEELVPITLERDVIKLRSVMGWWKLDLQPDGSPEWDWYIDPVSRVAYIRLTQFTDDTYSDLVDAWREITAEGKPAGLILDLRYNPGGLLTSAVHISNLFVREGVIVTGEDKDEKPAWAPQKADPSRAKLDGVPTVVLLNQGSASASEIVAGCLQAHGAGVVVGERSFGKGSVQTVHPVAANARLKLTTQYYRLPPAPGQVRGRLVHKKPGARDWGVDPDIVVKITPQQATDALDLRQKADVIPQDDNGNLLPLSPDRPDINRLLTEGADPQLEKALLILQAKALGNPSPPTRHALVH